MFGYIRDAITEIEREQASVQAEYDAFAEFGKTIQSIDTISTPSPDPPASSYSPQSQQIINYRKYRIVIRIQ
jgi:hypothetical protein